MPNAADIKIDDNTSFLLVGDGGTKKTTFIGTCPGPIYIFDLDAGVSVLRGRSDIDYDLFKEVSKGQKITQWQKDAGWYEWGTAWPAILRKLNEIGKAIDDGTNKYRTLGVDSLTLLTDCCLSFIIKQNGGEFKDGRQMWGVFLNNMSELFGQLSAWPLVKVLTAHVKRDENLVLGTTEKLPNVPGQFSGKVGVYFDEVYFTEVLTKDDKNVALKEPLFVARTVQDGTIRQAKSRKYNLPDKSPLDFRKIMEIVAARK